MRRPQIKTSKHPYRSSMELDIAFEEIEHGRGAQFNPDVADAFARSREYLASAVSKIAQAAIEVCR